jgi:hypothetical protein
MGCEAFPSATIVRAALDELKRESADVNLLQIESITDMHLVCIHGTAAEVLDSVIEFVSRLHGDQAFYAAGFFARWLAEFRGMSNSKTCSAER